MTSPEEFQKQLREWSRWKHKILDQYLGKLTGRLQNQDTIFVVDGFAGPGRYTEDNQDGSPLLAAQLAQKLESDRWYNLICINVEENEEVFLNLENATRPYSQFVTNFNQNFSTVVPEILEAIGEQPALFFLDPLGLKGLEWSGLEPIFKRGHERETPASKVTELIIRFDIQRALRDLGFAHSEWEHSESHFKRLLNVLGIDNDSVLTKHLAHCQDEDVQCRQNEITQIYQDQLGKYFKFVLRIPIRSNTDQLKYFLIFATRHLKGVVAMNDTLYAVELMREEDITNLRSSEQKATQLSMFEVSPEEKMLLQLERLKQVILKILLPEEWLIRDDLRGKVALLHDLFGRYSSSHFTAVLGGKPKRIKIPKDFQPLDSSSIRLEGTPSDPKTKIYRLK